MGSVEPSHLDDVLSLMLDDLRCNDLDESFTSGRMMNRTSLLHPTASTTSGGLDPPSLRSSASPLAIQSARSSPPEKEQAAFTALSTAKGSSKPSGSASLTLSSSVTAAPRTPHSNTSLNAGSANDTVPDSATSLVCASVKSQATLPSTSASVASSAEGDSLSPQFPASKSYCCSAEMASVSSATSSSTVSSATLRTSASRSSSAISSRVEEALEASLTEEKDIEGFLKFLKHMEQHSDREDADLLSKLLKPEMLMKVAAGDMKEEELERALQQLDDRLEEQATGSQQSDFEHSCKQM